MISDRQPDESRSALMRKVRRQDTKPEMVVRRLLHRHGYRFRLHIGELPGHPDIVFRSRRKVIFVHGCFWHRHEGCKRTTTPKIRRDFWVDKFTKNQERDTAAILSLEREGWEVAIVWECETEDPERLRNRLLSFLEGSHTSTFISEFPGSGS